MLAETTVRACAAREQQLEIPFVGGWVGYLGYEAGRFFEDRAAPPVGDISLPVAWFGLYGSAALYDHLTQQWYVVGVELT